MTDTLASIVERYITQRRALGRNFRTEEAELALLVRFAHERRLRRLDQLSGGLIEAFLVSRPRSTPRSFNHLRGVVARFLDWAIAQELLASSPLSTPPRRTTSERVPFLFDVAQARLLLDAAGALPDDGGVVGRGLTYRTIFALCYALGLRAGEACGLHLGDIDVERDLLVVVGGKFRKSRLVPHGPRIARLVAEQVRRRTDSGARDPAAPLFSFDGRNSVSPQTASAVFHRLVGALNLPVPDGVAGPTLHSLRHSFAVACLLRWYREGIDPATRLHQLSTYMGHADPAYTAVYLTITPALLEEANRRFESYCAPTLRATG